MPSLLATLGLTFSSQSLRTQIEAAGWEVKRLKFDSKRDKYEAIARSAQGDEIKQVGRTERLALSNLLLAVTRRNGQPATKIGRWRTTFSDQLGEIAQAYMKAPLYEPKASASFMALAKDCERRAEVLKQHLLIEVVNDPEPYKTPEQMIDDIKDRRKLKVSRAGSDHPVWSEDQVVAYRICHDVLGYATADAGWDWYGENEAFAAHAAVVPAEAQKALFTESIGATAYAAYYRAYGPPKVALFPQFMDKAQEAETGKGHPGLHPSQSYPPVPQPEVKPLEKSSAAGDATEPQNAAGLLDALDARLASAVRYAETRYLDPNSLQDPNDGWQSGEAPMMTSNGLTIAQAYGDPLDIDNARDNAAKIIPRYPNSDVGTEWAALNRQDPAQVATMKQAIVNAFRVVLLSPRKDLMWNAVHYQDIMHIPGDEDDPLVYWNALEKSRQDWNEARGYDRYVHVPYMRYLPALINVIYQRDPEAGYEAAKQRTQRLIYDWHNEIETRLTAEDEDKPEDARRAPFQIEAKANYLLEDRLKTYLAKSKPDLDRSMTREVKQVQKQNPLDLSEFHPRAAAAPEVAGTGADQDWLQQPDKRKYGAFMGDHLKAVANISRHADEILEAALQDVHEHEGTGWHFRAKVMQLGIPGVGPKVCSFAWLLLQPMTSELATIDTHILDTLGIHNEDQYSNRDYFGYERAFRARMDAAGYGHVPLGQLQWAMWDYKRSGPGAHQDHSAMRVLDPVPHENVDWTAKQQPINPQQALEHKRLWFTQQHPDAEWWAHTQDAGTDAWEDWQNTMAPGVAKSQIPYIGLPLDYDPSVYTSSLRTSQMVPWFRHYETGERFTGEPGESNMAHLVRLTGLSVPEIWERFEDAGKDPLRPPARMPVAPAPASPADAPSPQPALR